MRPGQTSARHTRHESIIDQVPDDLLEIILSFLDRYESKDPDTDTAPSQLIHPEHAKINACIALRRYQFPVLDLLDLSFARTPDFTLKSFVLTKQVLKNCFYPAGCSYDQYLQNAIKSDPAMASIKQDAHTEFFKTLRDTKKMEIATALNLDRGTFFRFVSKMNFDDNTVLTLTWAILVAQPIILCCEPFSQTKISQAHLFLNCAYILYGLFFIMNKYLPALSKPKKPDEHTIKTHELLMRFGIGKGITVPPAHHHVDWVILADK